MHYLEKQLHQTANHLGWKFDQFAAEYDLTGQQLSTIDFLANQPQWQSTQHAIEVEFNIKRSTTTKMLQRMEKAGLIVRRTANQDHRSKIVALTPHAKQLAKTARQYLIMRQQRLEKRFSPQELATFEQILAYLQEKSDVGETNGKNQ